MEFNVRRLLLGLTVTAGIVAGPSAWAAETAVKVGSWSLTVESLDKELVGKYYDLDRKRYMLRMRLLQQKLADHLLDLEAKAKGMTSDQFLKSEMEKRIRKITDEEVETFLKANRGEAPPSGDPAQEKSYVRQQMEEEAQDEAFTQFMGELVKKHKVEVLLQAPTPPRVAVNGPMEPSRGNVKAPVTIVEFSDFQCPYCKKGQQLLQDLAKKYSPDQVRVVFRHYPVPGHDQAAEAAEASMCAHEQGRFWEYHDALFAQQEALGAKLYGEIAGKLKLDADKFNACMAGNKQVPRISGDFEEGSRLGVTGTPTFFINGLMVMGAKPLAEFQALIDQELKK
ncbi:MAG: DsbA family protein [Magnetococcales bacterium]|nr:DsbA family protein [Magnetococcales bacterium]MBF0154354.1 DsbA family protein [Magnetococcales bacterium]MBF0308190.1 DsbA family protein [Magnetococcales bacterium]